MQIDEIGRTAKLIPTMIEHPVEIAFRAHSEKFGCTDFEISRREHPDLGLVHKMANGLGDLEVTGQYKWCERLFRFRANGNTDGFIGSVLVHAYLHRPLLIKSLSVACSLNEKFPGYSTVIHKTDVPSKRHLGHFFWGIGTQIPDFNFTEISLNAITGGLDASLMEFEAELKPRREAD